LNLKKSDRTPNLRRQLLGTETNTSLQEIVRKILIIKLRAIGDVVLSTIVIPNLRQAFPAAQIDFLTEKMSVEVVQGHPDLNAVLVFDRVKIQKLPATQQAAENYQFIRQLRGRKYDLVFDFFGNPRSALLTWLSGANIRVGYNWRGRRLFYNRVVLSRAATVHEAEFHLDALRALGLPIVSRSLHFPIDVASEAFAREFLIKNNLMNYVFLVGLNVSGGWEAKRWPLEKFAALADLLAEKCRAQILLFWGPGEKPYAQKVAQLLKRSAVLAPPTRLKQMGALMKYCQLVVSNDSGPMHISAALGTPTVGIFGPTNAKLQGPFGSKNEVAVKESLACLGCNLTRCAHNSCMKNLTVEEVWNAVQRCLKKNKLNC
jgi:lipopolysaccharide heptosyltransferase I